ncbi:single-stranded DNA-binding protein [Jiangella rhizosphaerae]|uniref:Single-stranded DNA-binding protein n=1 Tax=Jiangella rhizosphaerae TaxID=2293569 RepID=A0A418KH04_9ACTN|nr:single-stranded DNA-binding protein [Jiangella rhizosphaerae]RIQ11368.1 single-stranded DNA-binding protein [Jiangella rhizosphaerae]
MSEVTITVIGNVATEPRLDRTKNGDAFASFRLACSGAWYDQRTRSWVDDETSFYTVYCWKSPLADNIKASLRKGDPVVVHGRLKNREWRDANNLVRVAPEITARSLGHDLYRGTSSFTKVTRQPAVPDDDDAVESVRAAYYAAEDQRGVVDQRTGEILPGLPSTPAQFGHDRPADSASTPNGRASGGDRPENGAPAAVGDRMTAGDHMAAGDRLMGDDRTMRTSKAAPGTEANPAPKTGNGTDAGQAGADPRVEVPPTPPSGSRPRREKAGVPG